MIRKQVFLSVVMPEDLKRWVRVEAAQRDMSASAYVRELVVRAKQKPGLVERRGSARIPHE